MFLKSGSRIQCGILSNVNMDSIHMVIDQRSGLDSILVLHSRRPMNSIHRTSLPRTFSTSLQVELDLALLAQSF
jgi:hypothetical protein